MEKAHDGKENAEKHAPSTADPTAQDTQKKRKSFVDRRDTPYAPYASSYDSRRTVTDEEEDDGYMNDSHGDTPPPSFNEKSNVPQNSPTNHTAGKPGTKSIQELTKAAMRESLQASVLESDQKILKSDRMLYMKQKEDAIEYVSFLIDRISILAQILRLKLLSYSEWYDRAQIGIIVVSSLITLSQAIQSEVLSLFNSTGQSFINGVSTQAVVASGFSFFVLFSSAGIGLTSAVTKFKSWKKKADDMSTVYAASLYTVEILDLVRERIKLAKTYKEIQAVLSDKYLTQQYTLFQKTITNIRKLLPLDSQVAHTPTFFNLNIKSAKQRKEYENSLKSILIDKRKSTPSE